MIKSVVNIKITRATKKQLLCLLGDHFYLKKNDDGSYYNAFGNIVRYNRRLKKMQQSVAAYLLGINQNYLSALELGKRKVSLNVIEACLKKGLISEKDLFIIMKNRGVNNDIS